LFSKLKTVKLKKLLLFLFLIITASIQSQNNSLFWEISGNGLTKKSYLYGTMHVNDKVSFHLSDSFFKNLLSCDIVANESDPETWGELGDLMKRDNYNSYAKFYTEFYLFPSNKETIKTIFNKDTNYFKNMLSGAEGDQADFQENTVLDMFIYQTGRKYKKKIVGLENAKESMLSILQIKEDDATPKEENRLLMMKIIKNRNPIEVLKEYYRAKDIVMMDSIYKLMLSKKAHFALIENRNRIMAESIDSIAKTGSLFSAVGAAHLGGKKGIIELLRQKGYTVKPIIDVITESGQNQKKTIEAYFPNPNFSLKSTKDSMVQMPLYKNIFEENQNIGSPDFTNGGAINIKRIPLNYFIKKDNSLYNPKSLDSLFFEKIAGEIIQKKYFEQENYTGYDIKNITKTGNNQHTRFYITPLEIISISMTGPANYVRQYETEVFDNIKIKPFNSSWEKIQPAKGGFTIDAPAFNTVYGNTEKTNNIEIQAYDTYEKAYFFLKEKTLNDTYLLENSEYEHTQIQQQFQVQQDLDSLVMKFNKTLNTLTSKTKIGSRNVQLKTIIIGPKYYLLGTINASEANTNRFFNSFSLKDFNYKSKTEVYTDTIANFKIEIPKKENESLFLDLNSQKNTVKNAFQQENESYVFRSKSGKNINLQYNKDSKYQNTSTIDSIETKFRKIFLKQEYDENAYDTELEEDEDFGYDYTPTLLNTDLYSKKGFSKSIWNKIIADKEDSYQFLTQVSSMDKEKNTYTIDALVSKSNTTQAIKYKAIFKDNSYYLLNTLVDKNYKNDDAFIEKTFQSLSLIETTKKGQHEDKIKLFIEDANSKKDTIRYSALKSISQLEITKKDYEIITNFINTFDFKDNETTAIHSLLEKIGTIKDPRVIPFLEDFYKKETTKTTLQISVLKALSNQKSKVGYKKINSLLAYDLPLSDNQYEITSLFRLFENDAENSKELFPETFQYYSIQEYNKPIIDFCNSLLDKNLIALKKLNPFKKIILTNTKLEYKRVLSWHQKNKINKEDEDLENMEDSYNQPTESLDNLINYVNLMYNFTEDAATKQLFEKIKQLDIPQLSIELSRLGIINNKLTPQEIQLLLNDSKTGFTTINLLLNQNKKELISLSDDEISKLAIIHLQNLTEKDSVNLLSKKIVIENGKEISYYFYQVYKKNKESEITKKQLYSIAFINENKKINPLAYKVLGTKPINEEEILETQFQSIINQSLNENHTRASFAKENPANEMPVEEEY
jgi:uncharacterized protein YbaP (TraB family)